MHQARHICSASIRTSSRNRTASQLTQRALKRSVDIVGALTFFVFLGPLYLLVAAAVLIGMGGPVHYWQTRLGQDGRPFRCYKFRSMVKGSDEVLERHLEQ